MIESKDDPLVVVAGSKLAEHLPQMWLDVADFAIVTAESGRPWATRWRGWVPIGWSVIDGWQKSVLAVPIQIR